MAFGNGSHSLKRGFLRPNGGSRLPVLLIIALVAGCSLLLYNVYTMTVDRNSLMEENNLIRRKLQTCQRDKTELETKYETHLRSFRTQKEELERLRASDRSLLDSQKELKQCREQMVTLQNENAELKEEQKTDVDTCKQKLKTAEDKLDPCVQEKIRLEEEVGKLRTNLSLALQNAQLIVSQAAKGNAVDNSLVPKMPSFAPQQVNIDDNAIPAAPHRGLPEVLIDSTTKATFLGQPNVNVQDTFNRSVGAAENADQKQLQAPLAESAIRNRGNDNKNPESKTMLRSDVEKKSMSIIQEARTTAVHLQQGPTTGVKLVDASVLNREVNNTDANGRGMTETKKKESHDDRKNPEQSDAKGMPAAVTELPSIGDKAGLAKSYSGPPLTKRRNQKERRLNKVIEESAQVDERRRTPSDPNNDRSRGEQDDTAQVSETANERTTVTLQPPVPKRISVDGRADRIPEPFNNRQDAKILQKGLESSDRQGDVRNKADQGVSTNEIVHTNIMSSKGRVDTLPVGDQTGQNLAKDDSAKIFPSASEKKIPDRSFDDNQKENTLNAPNEIPAPPKAKPVGRNGLKDDYLYKDDDEEPSLQKPEKKTDAEEPVDKKMDVEPMENKKAVGDQPSDKKAALDVPKVLDQPLEKKAAMDHPAVVNDAKKDKNGNVGLSDANNAPKNLGDPDAKEADASLNKKDAKLTAEDDDLDKMGKDDNDAGN